MNHFLTIEAFNEQLKKWAGQQVKVAKLERDDVDEVVLALTEVSYTKDPHRLNEYEALYTLALNGEGMIETDNEQQPLPRPVYEIPLENNTLYEFDGEEFIIITDRAVYKMTRALEPSS